MRSKLSYRNLTLAIIVGISGALLSSIELFEFIITDKVRVERAIVILSFPILCFFFSLYSSIKVINTAIVKYFSECTTLWLSYITLWNILEGFKWADFGNTVFALFYPPCLIIGLIILVYKSRMETS